VKSENRVGKDELCAVFIEIFAIIEIKKKQN
jgi:hypothetical protein